MVEQGDQLSAPQERPVIINELADRYPSTEMLRIWHPDNKVLLERDFWIKVMQEQQNLGYDIPQEAIDAYGRVREDIDHDSIRVREVELRHDVKARLEEFNELASYSFAHLGLTSRDLTDNVEQLQVKQSLCVIRDRSVAMLSRFAQRAIEYDSLVISARTHNTPAQSTLLGRRFAMHGEELLYGYETLEDLIVKYPLRGIKGPVGTQTDQIQLLGGEEQAIALERNIAEELGFDNVLESTGQIYPRSLDAETVSALVLATAPLSNFALNVRLMAGNEQVTEGYGENRVGSSAMPHKMNASQSERINALSNVLKGFATMANGISGNQWYEGDVSDSVTRRVVLPNSFFASDGMFETALTVADEVGVYPKVIEAEVRQYLPFLTTTRLLVAAVQAGGSREKMHAVIQRHSRQVALRMRQKGATENNLYNLLAQDSEFPLDYGQIGNAMGKPIEYVGNASRQLGSFVRKVDEVVETHPTAASYQPESRV